MHALKTGNYRIREKLFREIMYIAEAQDFIPNVDAFASEAHCCFGNYWSAHSDAFDKHWGYHRLWINPPLKLLPRIVEKIYRDGAQ